MLIRDKICLTPSSPRYTLRLQIEARLQTRQILFVKESSCLRNDLSHVALLVSGGEGRKRIGSRPVSISRMIFQFFLQGRLLVRLSTNGHLPSRVSSRRGFHGHGRSS